MKQKSLVLKGTFTPILITIAAVYLTAITMVYLPDPTFKPDSFPKTSLEELTESGLCLDQIYENVPVKFKMRDGKKLFAAHYPKESDLTIIIIHGIMGSSFEFNKTSGMLREAGNADVYAVDLRGHGGSDGSAGDIDYIDQYVDDISDVVSEIKKEKPNGKIILMGHSMGGGIAQEYSYNKIKPEVDGYLLFAPSMDYDSPTISKKDSTPEGKEPFVKIHLSRILGLLSLNASGITWFNSKPTLFFNMPPEFPIHNYSFRAMVSMSPSDYKEGLKSIDKPLLVIVGSNDRAFIADQFEPIVKENTTNGKVVIIKDETHDGIHHNSEAMNVVKQWLHDTNL